MGLVCVDVSGSVCLCGCAGVRRRQRDGGRPPHAQTHKHTTSNKTHKHTKHTTTQQITTLKPQQTLYEKAEVNPYAGCLPSIATIPVFIGLYRSLTQVAKEGLLDTEGFYWIPNLAGPTSIDVRGTEWLWPLVDGAPPIGWDEAGAYLVLPALLVVAQYASSKIITPPVSDRQSGVL